MAETALAIELADEPSEKPRIIKISSKRQITIPSDMYKKANNPEYALATWNEDGSITIEPLTVRNEGASVKILRSLVDKGFEGDELVNEYEKIVNHIIEFNRAIQESLEDEAAGRERPFEELQRELEEKYGL